MQAILCLQAHAAATHEEQPLAFTVMNLTAKAETLSHRVEYDFLVQTTNSTPPVQCNALQTNINESLVNVSTTICDSSSGISFSWQQFNDGHAELTLTRNISDTQSARDVGVHTIGSDQISEVASGTEFEHQAYVGPSNFTVPATRVY
ncbi:hypothetical protein MCOR25_004441 [Pyricularia grisea]|uniref:AA1-like domain-containing protein n=1 Tax=Pyricularia grisea TaxID=148305 RepID=A0A6P8AUQ9_PYRGI|nr:uncharacterized protein PgNI_08053 [Pyricularia grisea]KAI6369484.1 hypothetical protein MCOR25_004441 [Pyricularia grisea]TLD05958.1 hypothetical protein PgNI_08053 [Pyricularia grisea]